MHRNHSLCVQHINYNICSLAEIIIGVCRLNLFYKNYVLLINSSNKVSRLYREDISYCLKRIVILLRLSLNDKYASLYICIDMKLLRSVIYINKKKIIKKEILYEIVLIRSFFIGN